MTKFIFVYGTLKQGEHNGFLFDGYGCQYIGEGVVPGCALIDMGGCPGMVITHCDPMDFAKGEIYEAAHIEALLHQLDRLENEGRLYKRVMLEVQTKQGSFDCWTYLYIPHIARNNFVKGGNWSLSPVAKARIHGGAHSTTG
jgi:gamma-glutamylcyclotransferase (GGCT)/AIG2-like uncharacterized protein YtfP